MKLRISQLREIIREEVSKLSEKKKIGLWDRIRAKRERGEKPAEPGDKDYPDEETWEKLTKESEQIEEAPAKGKKSSKTYTNPKTGRKNKVSYGQKGATISPGTSKGDSYCARSLGIKKRLPKSKQNDPNTPNNLSRKKWKCVGDKSRK